MPTLSNLAQTLRDAALGALAQAKERRLDLTIPDNIKLAITSCIKITADNNGGRQVIIGVQERFGEAVKNYLLSKGYEGATLSQDEEYGTIITWITQKDEYFDNRFNAIQEVAPLGPMPITIAHNNSRADIIVNGILKNLITTANCRFSVEHVNASADQDNMAHLEVSINIEDSEDADKTISETITALSKLGLVCHEEKTRTTKKSILTSQAIKGPQCAILDKYAAFLSLLTMQRENQLVGQKKLEPYKN